MTETAPALRIGVAGLGTVGAGVLKILAAHGPRLSTHAGRPLVLTAVSARNRAKDRGVDISQFEWEDDPVALARRDDIDLLIEVIGGSNGPAKAAAEAALARGAHVVTANKALLAAHGGALAEMAEEKRAGLRFEAAVAGGVPIVKALSDSLAANAISRVYGVLNGTCNFILTEMERTGRDYQDVLAEAQSLGYAEADPTADVGGWDAAHKLALLSTLAFGASVDLDGVSVEGIERISESDIRFAAELGYRIKLIATASRDGGQTLQQVAPCLIPAESAIGGLDGVMNAVVCEGDFVGQTVFEGPGAGEGPTASAIVADVLELARNGAQPVFGQPIQRLTPLRRMPPENVSAPYYVRLKLVDRPGALAEVTGILGGTDISIHQMRQIGGTPDPASVVIITHEARDGDLRSAVAKITNLEVSLAPPMALRIERA
ncbi:MAG: homoserine dehydrogenase [Rhodobacteraceae bacterium]|nr:homoserine dehydrogenase [Paracoccaceae bacterium]